MAPTPLDLLDRHLRGLQRLLEETGRPGEAAAVATELHLLKEVRQWHSPAR